MLCSSFALIRPWTRCMCQFLNYWYTCRCSQQTSVCSAHHTQPVGYNSKFAALAGNLLHSLFKLIACFMPCQNIEVCTLLIQSSSSSYFLTQVTLQNHNPTYMKHKNNIIYHVFNIKLKKLHYMAFPPYLSYFSAKHFIILMPVTAISTVYFYTTDTVFYTFPPLN